MRDDRRRAQRQAARDLAAYWREISPRPRRRRQPTWNVWSPAEERRLAELVGSRPAHQVAEQLEREFLIPRTPLAVRVRANRLGLSTWWDGYSQNQVAEVFGVTFSTVERWRRDGLLSGERWRVGRGRFGQWHFTEEDVARFIEHASWAYDLTRMQPGHAFTRRAEVTTRRDPWLRFEEAARELGRCPSSLAEWVKRGLVPHRRRVAGAGRPKIVIRARDLPEIREAIEWAARQNVLDGLARRVWRKPIGRPRSVGRAA